MIAVGSGSILFYPDVRQATSSGGGGGGGGGRG